MYPATNNFKSQAQGLLNALIEQLENAHPLLDMEDDPESLTLPIDEKVMLLTLNNPLQQLWYASPLSGAHHYIYAKGHWRSTRNPDEDLLECLSSEISLLLQSPVGLKYYD